MNNPMEQWPWAAGWLNVALLWAKRLFTPLAVSALLFFGWHARHALGQVLTHARLGYLAAAGALWVALHFLSPLVQTLILRACGSEISYAKAFGIFAQRLPGRYLPGGIWHTVGRAMDYHQHGIQPRHLATLVFLETVFPPVITFILGGMGLAAVRGVQGWGGLGLACAGVALLGLIMMPAFINARLLKTPNGFPLGSYYQAAAILTVYWVVAAATFICYLAAFPAVLAAASLIEVGATYLFSWGVGYVAIFAPQGIGVFEVVAGKLLNAPLSLGGMAALMAGFRLVILAADAVVWVLSRLR